MTDDARAVEALLADPTCCELACYEDPGCRCDGCKAVVGESDLAKAENARLGEALERCYFDLAAYGHHLGLRRGGRPAGTPGEDGDAPPHTLPGESCKCGLDEALDAAAAALWPKR